MAGASSRFTKEGMAPKYTLPTSENKTLFDDAVSSFSEWFETATFIFIVKDDDAYNFATEHAKSLNIENFVVYNLNFLTRGQAETVYIGLKETGYFNDSEQLMIFNIDSIRHNLELPDEDEWDTLFDAFYDEDALQKWSFCKVDRKDNIIRTAEKEKISPWCSTGLYIFKYVRLFTDAYDTAVKSSNYNFYIAPLYNYLTNKTNKLLRCPLSDVDFAGTPDEYFKYIKSFQ